MRYLLLVLLLPGSLGAQLPPRDVTFARTYFEQVRQLGAADGGRLWGRPVNGAMMFADARTRSIVANMPDKQGKLREENGVWIGTLPEELSVSNTAMEWAGRRWSMVGWPPPDNRYTRGRLLMHESFHRLQPELGLNMNDVANAHLASGDARIWLRLEWRALAEALLRSGAARRAAVADALRFRAVRRGRFPAGADEERQLELNEGLAEYTGFMLSGLPRSVLPDRAALRLAEYEQQSSFSRSFAYASGPAYGLLLDFADSTWRKRIDMRSDLGVLTARAYHIAAIDTVGMERRIKLYDAERMIAEERAQESTRLARETAFRKLLIDEPTLTLPVAGAFNYSFDPNGAVPITDVGIAYESVRVTDTWGVLTVRAGGVLLRRSGGSITGVVVPVQAGANAPTKGEGWELQLAPGWSIKPGARPGDWVVTQ